MVNPVALAEFADVEQLLVDHLNPEPLEVGQDPAPVSTAVPTPRPDRFYRVQRTGGVRRSRVTDAPIVVLESWGEDEDEARGMAEKGRAAMAALQSTKPDGVHQVYDVTESSGLVNLPDPLSDQARYTQTFELHIRGVMP